MMIITRRIFMRDMAAIKPPSELRISPYSKDILPPRALGLVMEWAEIHKDELAADWKLAKQNKPPVPIEPLK
jgi:hypothetical protein